MGGGACAPTGKKEQRIQRREQSALRGFRCGKLGGLAVLFGKLGSYLLEGEDYGNQTAGQAKPEQ